MSRVYIQDASGAPDDIAARKEIKELCNQFSVPFGGSLDTNDAVLFNTAEIVIVHLGNETGSSPEKVKPALKKLSAGKNDMNSFYLIIGVSSLSDLIEESWKCGFPAFYYSEVIKFLKRALQENKETRNSLSVCLEEIIKNYKQIKNIIRDFLPLNIDIQALSDKKVTNKVKYLKEMFKDTEKGFHTKKLAVVKNLIKEMVNGNNKDDINDLFTKDNYIETFLSRLDEMKEKIDTLKEQDVQNTISYSSETFPSFCHLYTALASCLNNWKLFQVMRFVS